MASLVEPAVTRWFVERVHRDHPETIDLYREMVAANPPMGYAANCRGILPYDIRGDLGRISCPTLVIAGVQDISVPVDQKKFLAEQIEGARLLVYEDASHTVPEELPEEFNRVTLEFLQEVIPSEIDRLALRFFRSGLRASVAERHRVAWRCEANTAKDEGPLRVGR